VPGTISLKVIVMNILIIGGTKFLGYHFAKQFLKDGHKVSLFNRGLSPDDFGDRITRIRGDRSDYSQFHRQLHGLKYDVVLDMIAYNAEDSRSAIDTFQGNVGHFIHISTAAVYVITKDFPSPTREEDFDRPLLSKSMKVEGIWDYGYNKRKCEEVLREAHQKQGFPVSMFRLPIVMGERDYTLRAYSYFLRIQDGGPIILPDGGLNVFTHVYQDDIVRVLNSNLMNKATFGEAYNIAQDEILTLRAFVKESCEIIGKSVELVDMPSDVLDKSSLGTSFSPLFHRRPFVLDVHKAVQDLGLAPTPVRSWLEKTINWFQNEYTGDPPVNYKLRKKELEFTEKYQAAMRSIDKNV
jgi:nucleoside-diphosphate-sugar epimerase